MTDVIVNVSDQETINVIVQQDVATVVQVPAEGIFNIIVSDRGVPGPVGPVGPQGIQGIQGVQGYSFYSGNGSPSNIFGVDGDYWLNLLTGQVFTKNTGAWVIFGSLTSPTVSIGQVDGGSPISNYGGTFQIYGGVP